MASLPRYRCHAKRRALWLALPGVLLLAACGPMAISDEQYAGLPEDVTITYAPSAPLVRWEHKPVTITITTWGPSNCPATATDIHVAADNTLTFVFETEANESCAGDSVPTTHVLRLPDDAQRAPLIVRANVDGVLSEGEYVLD